MIVQNCPACGGMHIGSRDCPLVFVLEPCVVCGDQTILACSDCAINSAGKMSVHVCKKPQCRDAHELSHATGGKDET